MLEILLFTTLSILYLALALRAAPYFAGYVAGTLSAIAVYRKFGSAHEVEDMGQSKGRFEGLDITRYGFKVSYWTVLYLVFWPIACIVEGIVMSRRFLHDIAYFPQ
jgi:hypothetical protein